MQKVNIYLDEDLWTAFRIACLHRRISASQQIGLLLVQCLHEQECQEKTAETREKLVTSGDESPTLAEG